MQNIRILSKNIIEQALSWNVWRALKQYLEIIDKREARILAALAEPVSLNDLCAMGLIYGKKFLVDEWVRAWDALTVRKHLDRLSAGGIITCTDGKYLKKSL